MSPLPPVSQPSDGPEHYNVTEYVQTVNAGSTELSALYTSDVLTTLDEMRRTGRLEAQDPATDDKDTAKRKQQRNEDCLLDEAEARIPALTDTLDNTDLSVSARLDILKEKAYWRGLMLMVLVSRCRQKYQDGTPGWQDNISRSDIWMIEGARRKFEEAKQALQRKSTSQVDEDEDYKLAGYD